MGDNISKRRKSLKEKHRVAVGDGGRQCGRKEGGGLGGGDIGRISSTRKGTNSYREARSDTNEYRDARSCDLLRYSSPSAR
jgi:hypothetical protein